MIFAKKITNLGQKDVPVNNRHFFSVSFNIIRIENISSFIHELLKKYVIRNVYVFFSYSLNPKYIFFNFFDTYFFVGYSVHRCYKNMDLKTHSSRLIIPIICTFCVLNMKKYT